MPEKVKITLCWNKEVEKLLEPQIKNMNIED